MSRASTIVGDENGMEKTHSSVRGDKKSLNGDKEAKQEGGDNEVEAENAAEDLGKAYINRSQERLEKEVQAAYDDAFLVELDKGEDPKHLSIGFRWYLTILAGCQILNATYASSVLSSAFPLMEQEFGQSQEVVILTVSLFLVGYIIGPFFWSPLNELVGRKITFLSSLILFCVFTIPCALAPNITCLLICRFLAGCSATASMVTSGGVLADIWPPIYRGKPMALYSICPFAGPVLGPILGSFIVDYSSDYKWVHWSQIIFGGCCFIAVATTYPETMPHIILKRKARRLRKETKDTRWHTFSDRNAPPFKEQLKIAVQRPFKMLALEPIMIMTSLYIGVVSGVSDNS